MSEANLEALQRRVDALLRDAPDPAAVGPGEPPSFSPFVFDHMARANELAARLRRTYAEQDLEAAVSEAEDAARSEPRGLVKQAVKLFVTHDSEAARRLRLPTVEAVTTREIEGTPEPPSPAPVRSLEATEAPEAAPPPSPDVEDRAAVPSLTEPRKERQLDWYREDPFTNDHHHHWHTVYPIDGGGDRTQPRQGELFFYMHQQMLARYDTERVIASLPRLEPFPPQGPDGKLAYDAKIPEGYGAPGYATRRPGSTMGPRATRLAEEHKLLAKALDDGRLSVPNGPHLGPLTENQLGAATEPSVLYDDNEPLLQVIRHYGNLHGGAHVAVGEAAGPGPKGWYGVMRWTETAIRDPFFYRWHLNIDDLCAKLQNKQEENDFNEHAAQVRFRDDQPDIVLCLSRDIPGAAEPGFDFDAFGRERLGEDLSGAAEIGTTVLPTRFVLSEVTAPVPGDQRETYWTTHLMHEPFTYFLRVENTQSESQWVTVRTFFSHADLLEDRRMWIELDKFEKELAPGVNLLGRPDARSSVIKRKGVRAPGAEDLEEPTTEPWCDCGWPYTLLLPSGASTPEGTPFTLAVVLTDYAQDREPDHTQTCGSMSFCGARQNYPDRRRMGYPFDRPFKSRTIAETIRRQPSMTSIDLTIRCENERPPA